MPEHLNLEYEWNSGEAEGSHAYLMPAVEELIRKHQPDRVFDLGCGNGSASHRMAELAKVVGVDLSDSAIHHANKTYPELRLEIGSVYDDLAGKYGTFPMVVSLEVVEHLYDPRAYARTLFDLVRPGGIAVLSTPYHGYVKNVALAVSGAMDKHFTALWDGGHIKFWSMKTLSALLVEAGFVNIRFLRVGRIPAVAKSMIAIAERPAVQAAAGSPSQGRFSARSLDDREQCPLCASTTTRPDIQIDIFPIRICENCSFRFTSKILKSDAFSEYYSTGYGGLRQQQGQAVNANVNLHVLERMGLLGRDRSLLDIGSGYGFLLATIREKYAMRVAGSEIALSEVDYARDKLALDVVTDLEQLGDRKFDVICLFETIEHILDPAKFIAQVTTYLAPGGTLVIGTDNFRSAIVKSLGERFTKWIPHQHVSLFEPATLQALIESAGLAVGTKFSFTPWELEAQGFLSRMSNGRYGGGRYRLEDALSGENSRPYRLFELRKRINRWWVALSLRNNLQGELMFISGRKA